MDTGQDVKKLNLPILFLLHEKLEIVSKESTDLKEVKYRNIINMAGIGWQGSWGLGVETSKSPSVKTDLAHFIWTQNWCIFVDNVNISWLKSLQC